MTPLESALGCHDILATIFDHLSPGREYKVKDDLRDSCRKALASSAVTCTTLSHHALNALWRELDSVHPLLKILPSFKRVDHQYRLCGAILPEHWSRFQLYAVRVRTIVAYPAYASYKFEEPIHPSVWMFLAAKCGGSPVMPLLQKLFAYDLIALETSTLVFLLSPTLRDLNIVFVLGGDGDRKLAQDVTTSLFQTLPLMAPNLETIHYDLDIDLGYEYLESFVHLTRLTTLSIQSSKVALDGHALGILSNIGTLQVLSCHSIDFSNSPPFPRAQYMFQQLTKVLLRGHLDHFPIFMRSCQLPNLVQIEFHVDQPPSAGEPSEAFAAICQRCNPASLTSFNLVVYYAHTAPHPSPYSLLHFLEPLLALPNIETFHITFYRIMPSIHDDDLARFGRAWPRLSSFYVSGHLEEISSEPQIMHPTLAGLVALARGCPQLNSFSVPRLDMNIVPEETVALPLGHGLRYLSVTDIKLPSPESPACSDAATVLDRVFPSIDLKKAHLGGRAVEGWREFLELLGTMRGGPEDPRMDY